MPQPQPLSLPLPIHLPQSKAVTESPLYPESGLKIVRVKTLEEAVLTAQKMAEKGDVVTLSPACASFDLYPNFEARGRHFKRLVNEL